MPIVFDHTIVPSRDMDESAKFYERVFGFEDLGEDEEEVLHGLRINASSILFLEKSNESGSSPWSQGTHHYAFAMDKKKFDEVFSRVKSSGVAYGDSYREPGNKRGPGKAPGSKGKGRTIYFKDPSDNLLQILTY